MSSSQSARQISEQERRKEIRSAHEERIARFNRSEESERKRRESEEPADNPVSATTSTGSEPESDQTS